MQMLRTGIKARPFKSKILFLPTIKDNRFYEADIAPHCSTSKCVHALSL